MIFVGGFSPKLSEPTSAAGYLIALLIPWQSAIVSRYIGTYESEKLFFRRPCTVPVGGCLAVVLLGENFVVVLLYSDPPLEASQNIQGQLIKMLLFNCAKIVLQTL